MMLKLANQNRYHFNTSATFNWAFNCIISITNVASKITVDSVAIRRLLALPQMVPVLFMRPPEAPAPEAEA